MLRFTIFALCMVAFTAQAQTLPDRTRVGGGRLPRLRQQQVEPDHHLLLEGRRQAREVRGRVPAWQRLPGLVAAGAYCCGDKNRPDVQFAEDVVADVKRRIGVATWKAYASGLSNGGAVAHNLGCEANDVFDGIAPVSQTFAKGGSGRLAERQGEPPPLGRRAQMYARQRAAVGRVGVVQRERKVRLPCVQRLQGRPRPVLDRQRPLSLQARQRRSAQPLRDRLGRVRRGKHACRAMTED